MANPSRVFGHARHVATQIYVIERPLFVAKHCCTTCSVVQDNVVGPVALLVDGCVKPDASLGNLSHPSPSAV